MDALFGYFFTIGSALALGVMVVVLPSLWIYHWIKNRRKSDNKAY